MVQGAILPREILRRILSRQFSNLLTSASIVATGRESRLRPNKRYLTSSSVNYSRNRHPNIYKSSYSNLSIRSSSRLTSSTISTIQRSQMSTFTVLTDNDVQSLTRKSSLPEISHFADLLTNTFKQYSTTDEPKYQFPRTGTKRPSGQSSLFMPSTSPDHIGVKIVSVPPPDAKAEPGQKPPTLEVTLTLCNAAGKPIGVLNANELTAFRTSLGAMLLFRYRKNVKNIVMFGSGKQAYWHIRLAVILKGKDIETVTIVNRSSKRAEELLDDLKSDDLLESYPDIKFSILTPEESDYESKLKRTVQGANSIHCAVPSTSPLFPASWLLNDESSPSANGGDSIPRSDLYISAIGSYKLDMQELDPDFLKAITSPLPPHPHSSSPSDPSGPFIPDGRSTPVIVVDSIEACFDEAGEVVDAGLKEDQLLEIGKLADMIERNNNKKSSGEEDGGEGLQRWLEHGLVVYKSVGVGIMDVCIGSALVELARERGVGVSIENF